MSVKTEGIKLKRTEDDVQYAEKAAGNLETIENPVTGQMIRFSVSNYRYIVKWEGALNRNINFFNDSGATLLEALFIGLGGDHNVVAPRGKPKLIVQNEGPPAVINISLYSEPNRLHRLEQFENFVTIQCRMTGSKIFSRTFKIINNKGYVISKPTNGTALLHAIDSMTNIRLDSLLKELRNKPVDYFSLYPSSTELYTFFETETSLRELAKNQHRSACTLNEIQEDQAQYSDARNKEYTDLQQESIKCELIDKLQKELADFTDELKRSMGRSLKEDKDSVEKYKRELEKKQTKVDKMRNKVSKAEKEVNKRRELSEDLAEAARRCGLNEQLRTKKNQQLKNLQTEIDDLKKTLTKRKQKNELRKIDDELHEWKKNKEALDSHIINLRKDLDALQDSLLTANSNIAEMTEEIEQLKVMCKNRGVFYHYSQHISDLMDAIKFSDDFILKPIGPLGFHIQLKKSQWASIVEAYITKDNLHMFCVANERDLKIFNEMKARIPGAENTRAFLSAFFTDVSPTPPREEGFDNLLDILGITDAVAYNCFKIIYNGIDRVLLKNTIETKFIIPQNCDKVINIRGDVISRDAKLQKLEGLSEAEILKPIKASYIKEKEDQLTREKGNRDSFSKEYNDKHPLLIKASADLEETEKKIKECESAKRKITDSMGTVNTNDDNNLEPDTSNANEIGHLMEKKRNEAANLQVEIADLDRTISLDSEKKNEMKPGLNRAYKLWKHQLASLKQTLKELIDASRSIRKKLQAAEKAVTTCEANIKEQEFTVQSVEEFEEEFEDPEMDLPRSSDDIIKDIVKLKKRISEVEKENVMNKDEIKNALLGKRKWYPKMQQISKKRKAEVKTFRKGSEVPYNVSMESFVITASQKFEELMDLGGFKAELKFDLKNRKISTSRKSDCDKSYRNCCFYIAYNQCKHSSFHIINNIKFPEENKLKELAKKNMLKYMIQNPRRQFLVFDDLGDSQSIPRDRVTNHRPPVPDATPGTSSQNN